MLAAVPGTLFLIEHGLRNAVGSYTQIVEYVTLWPLVAGVVLGALFILVSGFLVPPFRRPLAFEGFRLVHCAAWIVSTFAAVKTIVGI